MAHAPCSNLHPRSTGHKASCSLASTLAVRSLSRSETVSSQPATRPGWLPWQFDPSLMLTLICSPTPTPSPSPAPSRHSRLQLGWRARAAVRVRLPRRDGCIRAAQLPQPLCHCEGHGDLCTTTHRQAGEPANSQSIESISQSVCQIVCRQLASLRRLIPDCRAG